MPKADSIQVHENHSGPIPQSGGCLHFRFIAYRDAEADAPFYGYGDTEANAISDYLRQIAEETCSNCDGACQNDQECLLTNGEAAAACKAEIERWHATQSTTHAEWRVLNRDLPPVGLETKESQS